MIEPVEMPAGALGFRISGEVTRRDYEEVLIPALREGIESGEEIRCFCQVGPEFDGYEAGAMLEDLKTGFDCGIAHHSAWKRLALATDIGWIRHAAALFGWMAPGEMKTFTLARGGAGQGLSRRLSLWLSDGRSARSQQRLAAVVSPRRRSRSCIA